MNGHRFMMSKSVETGNFSAALFIVILGVLVVFLTGVLVHDADASLLILLAGAILITCLTIYLLIHIGSAVYILIMTFPIENIFFIYRMSSDKYDFIRIIPTDIVIIVTLFCLIISRCAQKKEIDSHVHGDGPGYRILVFVSFLFFSAMSVLWAPHLRLSLYHFFRLLMNSCMFYLIVTQLRNEVELLRAIKILIATAVISAVGMLISTLPLGNILATFQLTDQLTMTFEFLTIQADAACFLPNKSGVILLIIGILFALGMLNQPARGQEKRVLTIISFFLIFTVFYTKARAPILSLFVAVIFLFILLHPFKNTLVKQISKFFSVVIVLAIVFMITNSYIMKNAESYYQQEPIQSERAFRDRLSFWEKAIKAVSDNNAWIFGLGIGGGTYYENPEVHVHNILFSVFVDFGFLGLSLLMVFLPDVLRMFETGLSHLPDRFSKTAMVSALGCLISIGLSGMLDYDYNFNLLWYAAAFGTAIYRHAVSTRTDHRPCRLSFVANSRPVLGSLK